MKTWDRHAHHVLAKGDYDLRDLVCEFFFMTFLKSLETFETHWKCLKFQIEPHLEPIESALSQTKLVRRKERETRQVIEKQNRI